MPGVRALTRDDVPRLAELHRKGFPGDRAQPDVEAFLENVLFDHPWVDAALPSLGYEDAAGRLSGCFGVMPRPMVLDGVPIRAAISNNFIVDADAGPGIVAFALARALRDLGADLVLGEANAAARDICERLGWVRVPARSRRWIRPLRPLALGVDLLEGRGLPGGAARLAATLCRVPDALLTGLPGSPLRFRKPETEDRTLGAEALNALIGRMGRTHRLRPCYDRPALTWLLETLVRTRRAQTLRGGIVAGPDERPAGWYLYYSRPGGMGRVLQLGAREGERARVLRHLFHDARQAGDAAVTGASDPAWDAELTAASSHFREGRSWMIAYTADPALREILSTRDAFLTRLETEAWITFAF